jgi:hypothetical protein
MSSQRAYISNIACHRIAIALTLAVAFPAAVLADGARIAVKAKPGEIVLTRNVSDRIAYRQPVSPGMALLVSPMPNQSIDSALGLGNGEVSDADAAGLGATPASGNTTSVGNAVTNALVNSVGGRTGNSGPLTGNNAAGGPMGAVGNATSGIGSQVTGAMSQIPMAAAVGGGH